MKEEMAVHVRLAKDAGGRELGMSSLTGVILALSDSPPGEMFEGVLRAARAHGRQRDDQSLLLIRRARTDKGVTP